MTSTGAKVAAGVGLASVAAVGLAWWLSQSQTGSPCGGSGSTANCAGGPVGTAILESYPPTMPQSPTWVPCEGDTYELCATAEYSGTWDSDNLGTVEAISPSGAMATWSLAYTSLGDWVALTTGTDGDLQVYILY